MDFSSLRERQQDHLREQVLRNRGSGSPSTSGTEIKVDRNNVGQEWKTMDRASSIESLKESLEALKSASSTDKIIKDQEKDLVQKHQEILDKGKKIDGDGGEFLSFSRPSKKGNPTKDMLKKLNEPKG